MGMVMWTGSGLLCCISKSYRPVLSREIIHPPLVCVCVCVCVSHLVCPTLSDPMDSSAHRILKERILEWISISFSPSTDVPCLKTPVLGVLRLISDSQGSSIA